MSHKENIPLSHWCVKNLVLSTASLRVVKNNKTIKFVEHQYRVPRLPSLKKIAMRFWSYKYKEAMQLKEYNFRKKKSLINKDVRKQVLIADKFDHTMWSFPNYGHMSEDLRLANTNIFKSDILCWCYQFIVTPSIILVLTIF